MTLHVLLSYLGLYLLLFFDFMPSVFSSSELKKNAISADNYKFTITADDEQWRYSKSIFNLSTKGMHVPEELRGVIQFKGPIDIVITWLDANDPAWQANFISFGFTYDPERFTQSREIDINLASLSVYFPDCGKIYIVSEQQMDLGYLPESFRQKISFVKHNMIINQQFLPTFSSSVLEANLWKIPGLSEIFMYLNDDFFIMKPFDADRIINAGPQVIVPSTYNPSWCLPAVLRKESFKQGHSIIYTNSNNHFISKFGYCIPYLNTNHQPYILSVSLQRYTSKLYPEVVRQQNKNRVRNYVSYKKGGDLSFSDLSVYIGEFYGLIQFSSNFSSAFADGTAESVFEVMKMASGRSSVDFMTVQEMPLLSDTQFKDVCRQLIAKLCLRSDAEFCNLEICRNRHTSLYVDNNSSGGWNWRLMMLQYYSLEHMMYALIALSGLVYFARNRNALKCWFYNPQRS